MKMLKKLLNETFYIIEIFSDYTFDWHAANLDYLGYPEGFNADGLVWQKTLYNGVYNIEKAKQGLAWISKRHPNKQFRLTKVTLIIIKEIL